MHRHEERMQPAALCYHTTLAKRLNGQRVLQYGSVAVC